MLARVSGWGMGGYGGTVCVEVGEGHVLPLIGFSGSGFEVGGFGEGDEED